MLHKSLRKNTYYCCAICYKGKLNANEDCVAIGKRIIRNEDIDVNSKANFFVAVADGVSNSSNGAYASKMCLQLLTKSKRGNNNLAKKAVDIHKKLLKYGQTHEECSDMQTTLCALLIEKSGKLQYVNVGDSRLYRFKNNELKQLSKDQSFVEMLYDKGKISQEQKHIHSSKNLVLSAIGAASSQPNPEASEIDESFDIGDIYLLCSDGLSDYVLDADIEAILMQPIPLVQRLQRLYDAAIENGSGDNISIAAVSKIK